MLDWVLQEPGVGGEAWEMLQLLPVCSRGPCLKGAVRLPALVWLPWILEEGCTEPPQRDLLLGLTEVSETPLGTR